MRNLDEFFQDVKPTLEYMVKGKKIVGDISTLAILKTSSIYQQKEMLNDEAKMSQALFDIVFGKEDGKFLIENLTPEGFALVAKDVTDAIFEGTGEKNKSPSTEIKK